LTPWRMRFQEPQFSDQSGPAEFAHGHAAFFEDPLSIPSADTMAQSAASKAQTSVNECGR
jgi:hypothetical protein